METPNKIVYMRSLYKDLERYENALKTFKDYSGEYEVYKQWYETKFEQLVVDKIKLEEQEDQQELRVMGVGSGSGEADYEMLTELLSRYPKIRNTVIEPADQMMQKYRHLVTSQQQSLSGVVFDWRQQKYEDYQQDCQQTGDVTKFHFIHVVHSLYHMPDLDAVLESLWERLDNGGVLLIIITSEKSGIHHVHEKFNKEVKADNTMTNATSADVQRVFDKLRLTCKVYLQPLRLDITKCFQDGDRDGDLILDFLANTINFRNAAPKILLEDYMQFLKEAKCSEVSSDRVLLNMDWNAIVIQKE
ncbi:histamine N-methyltransferase-like [Amphiura filiformis]|uniref:histamine N-methyltransferase-like n=1 Tax=Amphiura filiformis TaxID=82378 RepID=UPI003B223CE0